MAITYRCPHCMSEQLLFPLFPPVSKTFKCKTCGGTIQHAGESFPTAWATCFGIWSFLPCWASLSFILIERGAPVWTALFGGILFSFIALMVPVAIGFVIGMIVEATVKR